MALNDGILHSLSSSPVAPALHAAAVTPSDTGAITARALYVTVSGNIKVDMGGGETVTFTSVPVGIFPISVKRVYSTDTTATGIIALW